MAAMTEIADLAGGRADLLAQGAGIAAGFHCGRADEARYLRAAQLCIEAGADTGQVQPLGRGRPPPGRDHLAAGIPASPARSGPLAEPGTERPAAAGGGPSRPPRCALAG